MTTHPSWCDLTLCTAVEGEEPWEYEGAHRRRTAPVGFMAWFELVQVCSRTEQRPQLGFVHKGARVWAAPVEEVAPQLLGLLGSAGYTGVVFTEDQMCALRTLLSLVHYDDLAMEWFRLLPEEIRAKSTVDGVR